LAGLQTKARRGRKSILQAETDLAAVRRAVQSSRQKISLAEAEIEQELGKEFSQLTLRRFLKKRLPLQTHSPETKAHPQRRCVRLEARSSARPASPVRAGAD